MAEFIELYRTDGICAVIRVKEIVGVTGDDKLTTIYVGSSDEPFTSDESMESFMKRSGFLWLVKGAEQQ